MECKLTRGEVYAVHAMHYRGHAVAPCSVIQVSSSRSKEIPLSSVAYGVIVPDEHVRGESASLHAAHSNVQKANVCIAAEHATRHHPSPK